MGSTVRAYSNQSLADLVIQGCGSMEASMQFAQDNNMAVSDVPVVGSVYVVSDAALALAGSAGAAVVSYLAKIGNAKGPYLVGTLGVAPVVVAEVIYSEDGSAPLTDEGGNVLVAD